MKKRNVRFEDLKNYRFYVLAILAVSLVFELLSGSGIQQQRERQEEPYPAYEPNFALISVASGGNPIIAIVPKQGEPNGADQGYSYLEGRKTGWIPIPLSVLLGSDWGKRVAGSCEELKYSRYDRERALFVFRPEEKKRR